MYNFRRLKETPTPLLTPTPTTLAENVTSTNVAHISPETGIASSSHVDLQNNSTNTVSRSQLDLPVSSQTVSTASPLQSNEIEVPDLTSNLTNGSDDAQLNSLRSTPDFDSDLDFDMDPLGHVSPPNDQNISPTSIFSDDTQLYRSDLNMNDNSSGEVSEQNDYNANRSNTIAEIHLTSDSTEISSETSSSQTNLVSSSSQLPQTLPGLNAATGAHSRRYLTTPISGLQFSSITSFMQFNAVNTSSTQLLHVGSEILPNQRSLQLLQMMQHSIVGGISLHQHQTLSSNNSLNHLGAPIQEYSVSSIDDTTNVNFLF